MITKLKPISDKMFFAYLYDPKFKDFRQGDLEKIDVINYAFGIITAGMLDLQKLSHLKQIIQKAHAHGVRVVLSIGGWGADGFSQAVSSIVSRTKFITSIIDAIKNYQFDGVDIDWEYPTVSVGKIASSPTDKVNFTLFISELRRELNKINKDLLLTIAIPASNYDKYYELDKLNKDINYLHIMTYDMSSQYKTTHHTNLYSSKYSVACAHEAVKGCIESGISREKITIGIAFYGHIYIDTNGIGLPASKRSHISYAKIISEYVQNDRYQYEYDDDAKASWIYGDGTFISFEDEKSIIKKCEYARKYKLGGVMVWEYCQDDEKSTLITTIDRYLNKK